MSLSSSLVRLVSCSFSFQVACIFNHLVFLILKESKTRVPVANDECMEVTVKKDYFIPRYFEVEWVHTRSICAAYGMEIVSFDSKNEMDSFLELCKQKATLFKTQTHVGGMTLEGKSLDKWYWVNSGNKVSYSLPFGPNEPNNDGGREFCLSIFRTPSNVFAFNDIGCSGSDLNKFVCQQTG